MDRTAVLLLCTEDDNSCYRNVCKMSVVSFALAVVFIIMDRILEQKKKPNDPECEDQYVLSQKTKRRKIRTYSEELGFAECPSDVTKPQCIVCYKTLSSEGMKPAKLKQNLMTQYREVTGKFQTFLKQKEYLKQKKAFTKSLVSIEKLMNASYFVALRVARAKNVHTIVEY